MNSTVREINAFKYFIFSIVLPKKFHINNYYTPKLYKLIDALLPLLIYTQGVAKVLFPKNRLSLKADVL